MVPAIHADVAALAPLLGSWSGNGHGHYPTIEPFDYFETLTFEHVGKPFLAYGQRTAAADDGRPLHAERGYLRLPSPGQAELVVAHPTGIAEVQEGPATIHGASVVLRLASTLVGLTTTAKRVDVIERTITVEGDELRYQVRMAAVGLRLQDHLDAVLYRQ